MDIFEEHVLDSDGVCNNCFTRTHDVIDDWYPETLPKSTKAALQDQEFVVDRTTTERLFPPMETADGERRSKRLLAYPPSRNACLCGSIDRRTTIRPLTTNRAIELTHNLVDRLDEAEIDYDEDALYDAVRDLKTNPAEQFSDDSIFERAINRAIEAAEDETNADPTPLP